MAVIILINNDEQQCDIRVLNFKILSSIFLHLYIYFIFQENILEYIYFLIINEKKI